MSDIKAVRPRTPREIAESELAAEKLAENTRRLKELLRRRDAAKTVLENIERDIADADLAIEQGN